MESQRVGHNKVVKKRGAGALAHGKQLLKQNLPSFSYSLGKTNQGKGKLKKLSFPHQGVSHYQYLTLERSHSFLSLQNVALRILSL